MMHLWTDEMIMFMDRASAFSSYFEDVEREIEMYLEGCTSILDAGCGIGQLSIELSKHYGRVAAVDLSERAIAHLRGSLRKKGIANVEAIAEDLHSFEPEEKFDAAVFNYFGRIDEIVSIASRIVDGTVIAIKRNYPKHRFSLSECRIDESGRLDSEEYLRSLSIPYSVKEIEYELGQPLADMDEALSFFRLYSRDKDRSIITKERIAGRLVESEIPGFRYYLPQTKRSRILVFNTKDMENGRHLQ